MKKLLILIMLLLPLSVALAQEPPTDSADAETPVAEETSDVSANSDTEAVTTPPEALDETRVVADQTSPEEAALQKEAEENEGKYFINKSASCSLWYQGVEKESVKFNDMTSCEKSPLRDKVRMDIKMKELQDQKDREEAYQKRIAELDRKEKVFDSWAKNKPKNYKYFKESFLNQWVQSGMPEDLVTLMLGRPTRESVTKGVKQLIFQTGDHSKYIFIIDGKVDSYQ